jgi:hypothetical protein
VSILLRCAFEGKVEGGGLRVKMRVLKRRWVSKKAVDRKIEKKMKRG